MRILLSALTVGSLLLAPVPALAGPAEAAFLAKLPGTWTGSGALTGGETGTISCTLTLRGSDKISFNGTCDAGQFGPQSYSGVLTYNDDAKQYQARSNGQTVVGVKSAGAVTFKSKMKSLAGTGDSVMKISATSIVIDVNIVRSDTNEKLKTHLVFKK